MSRHRTAFAATAFAAATLLAPGVAHAQRVPGWLVVAVLSPVVVFAMCIVLGVAARSVRVGAFHAALVLGWIVLFSLAAYFVENDYVIWTPIVLYLAHAALLPVLIVVAIARRIASRRASA